MLKAWFNAACFGGFILLFTVASGAATGVPLSARTADAQAHAFDFILGTWIVITGSTK